MGQGFPSKLLKIIDFVEQLPGNPIISAFTATATEVVKNDIAKDPETEESQRCCHWF